MENASIMVFVGSSYKNGDGGTFYDVLEFIRHPGYVDNIWPFSIHNDIAVMKTVLPIQFNALVQPIPLGILPIPPRTETIFSGWGSQVTLKYNLELNIFSIFLLSA